MKLISQVPVQKCHADNMKWKVWMQKKKKLTKTFLELDVLQHYAPPQTEEIDELQASDTCTQVDRIPLFKNILVRNLVQKFITTIIPFY